MQIGQIKYTHLIKTNTMTVAVYNGYDYLYNLTGCKLPCQITKYTLKRITNVQRRFMKDPELFEILDKRNDTKSPTLLVTHSETKKIKQYEEVIEYDGTKFIGDIGGLVGIFVGLSLLSIIKDIVCPLIQKIITQIKNK